MIEHMSDKSVNGWADDIKSNNIYAQFHTLPGLLESPAALL